MNSQRNEILLGKLPEKQNNVVHWAFKLVKNDSAVLTQPKQGFKELTYGNIQTVIGDMENDDKCGVYNANSLRDNLSMMIHDYQWEDTQILSPLKRPFSKFNCKRPKFNDRNGEINANYVFILGPVPLTMHDLDNYFEWNIKTAAEIENVLMPSHLATHFRRKHNINMFWVDTCFSKVINSKLL